MAQRLRTPLADPFAEEVIVVPSGDIAAYLKRELGRRLGEPGLTNGIVSNVRFVYPRQLINATISDPVGLSDSPWDAQRLTWRISALLDTVDASLLPRAFAVAPLAASRRAADLFDRYVSHRPDMLAAWAKGNVVASDDAVSREWQMELYRRVTDSLSGVANAVRLIDDPAGPSDAVTANSLPQRITVFGVDSLSRASLQVLAQLDSHCDVAVYWTFPVTGASLAPAEWTMPRTAYRHDGVVHPITSRWATHLIESKALLGNAVDEVAPLERGDSVLHRIQRSIITDSPAPPVMLSPRDVNAQLVRGDGTVQIHACYGLYRQVEALRDSLLHVLNTDPSIRLRDILIVAGDAAEAAPVLNAVFQPETPVGANVPRLPINVVRGTGIGGDDVVEAFLALLNVLTSRFSVGDVTDLASLAPIGRKFSFDAEAIDLLATWAEQMRVQYGLTTESRTTLHDAHLVESGTWAAALDRLMMGIAVPAESDVIGPGGVVPYDGISSSDLTTAGNVAEFLSRLEQAVARLRVGASSEGLSLVEWRDALLSLLDDFIDVPRDRQEYALRMRDTINAMYLESAAHPELSGRTFSVRDLRMLTDEYFHSRDTGFGTRFEAITVTEFGSMNHVPYKVIAFLGADEEVFAGSRVDGDDILSIEPHVGEPIYSLRARNNFLNLLLAAQKAVIVTCTGADVRSNKEIQLAVPIRELMEYVAAELTNMAEAPTSQRVYVRHPRHNFDAQPAEDAALVGAETAASPFATGAVLADSAFTFDATALDAQHIIAAARRGEQLAAAAPGNTPTPTERAAPDMGTVHSALIDPIKFFYEDVLNVDVPKIESSEDYSQAKDLHGDGILALTIDNLEKSAEGRTLLRKIINGLGTDDLASVIDRSLKEWSAIRPHTGLLPPGEIGALIVKEVVEELRDIIGLMLTKVPNIAGEDMDCDVLLTEQTARLRVENVVVTNDQLNIVRVEYKRPAMPMLLTLWADIAAVTIHTGGTTPAVGHLGARPEADGKPSTYSQLALKGSDATERVRQAMAAMAAVSDLVAAAQQRPVPLFASASPRLARAQADGGERMPKNKLTQALKNDLQRSAGAAWFVGDRELDDLLAPDSPAIGEDAGEMIRSEMEDLADEIWGVFHATTHVIGYGEKKEDGSDDDGGDDE